MRRGWLLAPIMLFAACAAPRTATIDATTVDRMPTHMRKALEPEEDAVQAARDRVQVAERSLVESRDFAARTEEALAAAEGNVPTKGLIALQAGRDFAHRLLALRQARLEEAQAEVRVAQSDYRIAALRELERANAAGSIDTRRIYNDKLLADRQLADARLRSANFQTLAAQARTRWELARRASQTAARGWMVIPPEPPPPVPAHPGSAPPPGFDLGPSAPQSVPLPTPQQLP